MEINELPPELLVNIFHYVDQLELLNNVGHVCPYWGGLKNSARLWHFTDLNLYLIEDRKRKRTSKQTSDLIKKIIDVIPLVQHLKITPERLLELKNVEFNIIMKNLRWLELTPTCVMSPDVFQFVHTRCPNLQKLELNFFTQAFPVLESVPNELNVEELCITHQDFCPQRKWFIEERTHHKCTYDIAVIQHLFKIPKTFQVCSWSSDFLAPVIETACSNITSLKAFGAKIDDTILHSLSQKAEYLTELRLDFSRITDGGLEQISKSASNLKVLSLQFCDSITDRGISTITKDCPRLEQIYLCNAYSSIVKYGRDCTTGVSLSAISKKCSSLTALSIQYSTIMDDDRLSNISRLCHGLTSISFNRCLSFWDTSLEIIAENCHVLKLADFSQCSQITLNGVWAVIVGCHEITHLSLLGCQKLTDFHQDGVTQASDSGMSQESDGGMSQESCSGMSNDSGTGKGYNPLIKKPVDDSKLQVLNLAYCDRLDVASLSRISKKCKLIQTLILRCREEDCEDIPSNVLQSVFTNCWLMKEIYVGWRHTIYKQEADIFFQKHRVYPTWTVKKGLCKKTNKP